MRSKAFAQNFLRNRKTARRLAYLAGDDPSVPCYDLGAGTGMITEECLARFDRVTAIEVDDRLVDQLRERFADAPGISVIHADLLTAAVPAAPFVVAANPPFNISTALCRRWLMAESFVSGALIFEKPFASRLAGNYGPTKHSLAFAPFVDLAVERDVSPAEFAPRPRAPAAILVARRRDEPSIGWSERAAYWQFVNYLFERSHPIVGDALQPLRLGGDVRRLLAANVRDLTPEGARALYRSYRDRGAPAAATVSAFERSLPASRQMHLTLAEAPAAASRPGGSRRGRSPAGPSSRAADGGAPRAGRRPRR